MKTSRLDACKGGRRREMTEYVALSEKLILKKKNRWRLEWKYIKRKKDYDLRWTSCRDRWNTNILCIITYTYPRVKRSRFLVNGMRFPLYSLRKMYRHAHPVLGNYIGTDVDATSMFCYNYPYSFFFCTRDKRHYYSYKNTSKGSRLSVSSFTFFRRDRCRQTFCRGLKYSETSLNGTPVCKGQLSWRTKKKKAPAKI